MRGYFNFLIITLELDEKISGLIHEIKTEIDFNIQKNHHLLRALLYEVLMLLNRAYIHSCLPEQNKESLPCRYMSRFIVQVNISYKTNHDITFYAGKLCITPGHLNQIVRSATGGNAKQYIRKKLLQEAKRLIVYTELFIGEIAEQLEYENTSYFIWMFCKETEQTPLEYRKSYLWGNSLF